MRKLINTISAAAAGTLMVNQAASAQTNEAGEIEQVVVTAQRRAEYLTEVPMSVTALSGSQLEAAGLNSTHDLTQVTPGLVLARSSSYFQPTIRGVGNRNITPGDEPNVATYIDGVYQPEQSATLMELANIERIEVLKGPQGTLFGRNATGGAINVITRSPSRHFESAHSITAGEFGYWKGTTYVSGGLNESGSVAASLSAVGLRDDGYIRNVYLDKRTGDRESYAARAKFFFTPNDSTEIQVNGLYSYDSSNAAFSGQPLNGSSAGRRLPNPNGIPEEIAFPQRPRRTATQFVPENTVKSGMIDLHLNKDLGFAALQAIASYAQSSLYTYSDLDISPFSVATNTNDVESTSTTQELLLTSLGESRWQWLAGVSLFQGESFQEPQVLTQGSAVRAFYNGQDTRAAAAFAELTYELMDNLFVTGGLRYSWDEKRSYFRDVGAAEAIRRKSDWDDVSPRAVLRYQFSPRASAYLSYTEGYKTGTYNTSSLSGALKPAGPENVEAYELGAKADLSSGWSVSGAVFRYSYTDLQTSVANTVDGNLVVSVENAPEARIDGAEFTLAYQVNRRFWLNTGLSLLRPEVRDFPNASIAVPVIINGLPAGNANGNMDVRGNDLIRAPRYSVNVGGAYTFDFRNGAGLAFAANALFSDKYYVELSNRVAQPSHEIVNASVTYTAPGGRLKVTAFGQNLTDELYFLSATISSISDTISYSKPRWFGLTLGYEF